MKAFGNLSQLFAAPQPIDLSSAESEVATAPAAERRLFDIYLSLRFFIIWVAFVLGAALGIWWVGFTWIFLIGFFVLIALALFEATYLYYIGAKLHAGRGMSSRFGLFDDNPIYLEVDNRSSTRLFIEIIDELPIEFQRRDFAFHIEVPAAERRKFRYTLKPTGRGVLKFGRLRFFISSPLGLVQRRLSFDQPETRVAVYPSVLQMKQQTLRAQRIALREGSRRLRQFGHSYEFEQIKPYVPGDDHRHINWKATARTGELMLNMFQEERSQQIIAVIDTGRSMLYPFSGMSLVDYAVNASLALLNVAASRGDKVGAYAFDAKVHSRMPPSSRPQQMMHILEQLYAQQNSDLEPDFDALYDHFRHQIKGRSLIILFSNITSQAALERSLPALQRIARAHRLLLVDFINEEVSRELEVMPQTLEEAMLYTVAAEYEATRSRIASQLELAGIMTLRTTPEQLSANVVTRYLSIKKQGLL